MMYDFGGNGFGPYLMDYDMTFARTGGLLLFPDDFTAINPPNWVKIPAQSLLFPATAARRDTNRINRLNMSIISARDFWTKNLYVVKDFTGWLWVLLPEKPAGIWGFYMKQDGIC